MISLTYPNDDFFVINGKKYEARASFDIILAIIDCLSDKRLNDYTKLIICIQNFFGKDTDLVTLEPNELMSVFNNVFAYYTKGKEKPKKYDDLGNEIPEIEDYDEDVVQCYSLKQDANYIYGAFVQTYGIDLVESQGKLHWFKFQALLESLPDDTKFRQIIKIRQWKPRKGDSTEYKRDMRKLQDFYSLGGE